jgi:hypothetical protein
MSDIRVRLGKKKAAKITKTEDDSVWNTLAQRICALFQTYTDERTWKGIGVSFFVEKIPLLY